MNRREFLRKCGAAFAAVSVGGSQISKAAGLGKGAGYVFKRKTNVLFVLTDQWRYCAFSHGELNDKPVRTPNLDKFVKEGVRWRRCYAAHPICTPNRATIITGRWPWQTGMNHNELMLPSTEQCIAQKFTKAEYKCHYIGKWHMDGPERPGFVPKGWRRRGFTTFEGFNRGHFYFNSPTFTDDGVMMSKIGLYKNGEYEPTLQTDLAIKFLKENKNRPFFCYVSWGPPHTPYELHPKEYSYDAKDVQVRPNVPANRVEAAKKSLSDYFAHCTALDNEFGRLMKALDDLHLADNTLVVFTSDHGDMHGSHGKLYKNLPEEESWRVPLFMRLPKRIKGGMVVENLIGSADLMPTILSMCGLGVPGSCSGKDKSAAMSDKGMHDESIYGGVQNSWRGVVKGDYKLIVNAVNEEEIPKKLYNLKADPYEMNNLVDDAASADVKADLLGEIQIWKTKTADPFPKPVWNAKAMYEI